MGSLRPEDLTHEPQPQGLRILWRLLQILHGRRTLHHYSIPQGPQNFNNPKAFQPRSTAFPAPSLKVQRLHGSPAAIRPPWQSLHSRHYVPCVPTFHGLAFNRCLAHQTCGYFVSRNLPSYGILHPSLGSHNGS
eukprot:Gb_22630 [translate_table: standard]